MFNWKLEEVFKAVIGAFLFSIAMNFFISPNHLYTGGVLGISQLIRSTVNDLFNLKTSFDYSGIIYYLINIPLFFVAYRHISKQFFYRTIFTVSLQALMISVLPSFKLLDDILTNVLVGGIIAGTGVGLLLSSGGSTGGTDILGLYLAKKNNHFSVGKIGLFVNIFIFGMAGIRYGIEIMIYSIIYSAIDNVTLDKMHEQNICSTAIIFCKKNPKRINDFIKDELKRDSTYWIGNGGYDNSKTYIIYTALTKYELSRLEKEIKNIDDHIFVVKSEGVGIRGEFKKDF